MKNSVKIMGILNATDDSLFGARLRDGEMSEEVCLRVMEDMVMEGADIIDVGGESSAPGSVHVDWRAEWSRIEPFLRASVGLKKTYPHVKISVDTYKSEVFDRALLYDVDMLNDVTGLRGDPRMLYLLTISDVEVCVMYAHTFISPTQRTSTSPVEYRDVVHTISEFFTERISVLRDAGISEDRIILDPGMGSFVSGNPEYSVEILHRLRELYDTFSSHRILIGVSRKGFTGMLKNADGIWEMKYPVEDRLAPSLEYAKIAIQDGASIVRVHDVAETKRMIKAL